MSEDRPADDQGEGVDTAVGLPSDVLAELVGSHSQTASSAIPESCALLRRGSCRLQAY
jgi:hypothetical protein